MARRPGRYMPAAPGVPVSSPMMVPRAYYLQDDTDFSDGEMEPTFGWTENSVGRNPVTEIHESMMGASSDVTELYRRKAEEHYMVPQEVVVSDEPRYYYRPAALARLPQRRLPVAVTSSNHGPPPLTPAAAYYPPPLEEPRVQYEGVVYRSSPHLQRLMQQRSMSPNPPGMLRRPPQVLQEPPVNNLVRSARPTTKVPVSVRTPRFYRRTNLYKRPSTLCLQLPSSPDPASRPIKPRFPSTMPGHSVPPLNLRPAQRPQYQQTLAGGQRVPTTADRVRATGMCGGQREMDDMRRSLTARSAPPMCTEERVKEEELDRIQRIILESRGTPEFNEESGSNQGDTEPKCSELELLLNQYEQIFNSGAETPGVTKSQSASRRSSTRSRARRKTSMGRIAGLMKPRLPPSLKNVQKRGSSKMSLKQPGSSTAEEDRLEIEQMTAEVLDTLLQDLSVGGLVGDAPSSRSQHTEMLAPDKHAENKEVKIALDTNAAASKVKLVGSKSGSRGGSRAESRSHSRGASARDKKDKTCNDEHDDKLENNICGRKSEHAVYTELKSFDEIPTKTTFMTDKDKFSKYSNSSHTSFVQDKVSDNHNLKKSTWTATKKTSKTEEHSALELHRSKSYIVNLIDRALSRELGTIPEERTDKQYLNLDAQTAMDLISSKNMDNEICLEISQAIADSFGAVTKETSPNVVQQQQQQSACCSSNHAADCARGDTSKPDGELMFSTGTEEPLYIKQLKKLRWGHLKHIQREMRRLEDLERFLDSCGSDK